MRSLLAPNREVTFLLMRLYGQVRAKNERIEPRFDASERLNRRDLAFALNFHNSKVVGSNPPPRNRLFYLFLRGLLELSRLIFFEFYSCPTGVAPYLRLNSAKLRA